MPVLTEKYLSLSRIIKIYTSMHRKKKKKKILLRKEELVEYSGKKSMWKKSKKKEKRIDTKGGFEERKIIVK